MKQGIKKSKIIGIHFQGQYIECAIDNNNQIIDCFLDEYKSNIELEIINEYQMLVKKKIEYEIWKWAKFVISKNSLGFPHSNT